MPRIPYAQWLAVEPVPFVPELLVHQTDDLQGLWEQVGGAAPPYWAVPWLGGQALARYVLDTPASVAGLRVLDLATGSGLVALAALRAGALSVLAADIDPLSEPAVAANAEANAAANAAGRVEGSAVAPDRRPMWTGLDLLDGPVPHVDVVLAGDVLYDRAMAPRVLGWLRGFTGQVLLGDPGRDYLPREGLQELASYDIPTTRELEGVLVKRCRVFTLA